MSQHIRLLLGSFAFAVLWSLVMIWSTGADRAYAVIIAIAGVLAGVLWYFGMRLFAARQTGQEHPEAARQDGKQDGN